MSSGRMLVALAGSPASPHILNKMGVTPHALATYNTHEDMITDAAQRLQFAIAQLAFARVLAALPGMPTVLSCEFAFPSSARSLR
jgi:hypothetical protein